MWEMKSPLSSPLNRSWLFRFIILFLLRMKSKTCCSISLELVRLGLIDSSQSSCSLFWSSYFSARKKENREQLSLRRFWVFSQPIVRYTRFDCKVATFITFSAGTVCFHTALLETNQTLRAIYCIHHPNMWWGSTKNHYGILWFCFLFFLSLLVCISVGHNALI